MDDDPMIRKLMAKFLDSLGYDVDLAGDADETIARFEAARNEGKPYAAVVLDITIRGGPGGEEAIRQLRELDPDVKAIVASGHADKPLIANFRDYGFAGALTKPFTIEELSGALNQVITQP